MTPFWIFVGCILAFIALYWVAAVAATAAAAAAEVAGAATDPAP